MALLALLFVLNMPVMSSDCLHEGPGMGVFASGLNLQRKNNFQFLFATGR